MSPVSASQVIEGMRQIDIEQLPWKWHKFALKKSFQTICLFAMIVFFHFYV